MNNNEEKNLPQNENAEEITEVNESPKKQLPLGALIGIIAGAVAVVVAVVLIIVLSGNGNENKCDGHVDADDDYLCDKCGEHFDDGDEAVIPEVDKIDVTFTVKLDNGAPLSGVKFILTRGDKTLELTSGADGSVVGSIEAGAYYVTYDHETLPEYCWGETYGVKIEEGTTSAEILIVDNRPDGSANKPYPTSDEATEITIAPGEELYYSCRGTSLRYVTINSSDLIVNYMGETYSAVDGVITVGVSSVDVETPTIFSVKNISDSSVTAVMDVYAPLGSYDNPIELTESSAVAEIPTDKTVYYVYKAEKDGIFVITSPTEGGEILITRNIIRITDGVEEIVSTITASGSYDSAGYIYVTEGDEIKIGVSYVAPAGDNAETVSEGDDEAETEVNNVELSFAVYAATEEDPAPILNNGIYIRLDKGASVVFSAEIGTTVTLNTENDLTLMYNGSEIAEGSITITEETRFTVINSTDELAIFTLIIK